MATNQMYVAGDAEGNALDPSDSRFFNIGGRLVTSATEANYQLLARDAYTWSNIGARVISNNLDATSSIFARLNGVDQSALEISIGAGVTGFIEDTSGSVTVADGDLIGYRAATGSGAHGDTLVLGGVVGQLQHASFERPYTIISGGGLFSVPFDGDEDIPIVGAMGSGTTVESRTALVVRQGVTYSNLRIRVLTNGTTAASTFTLRRNAVDTALSISIPAGTTGSFEDTDTVDVIRGLELNYKLLAGTGMGGAVVAVIDAAMKMAGAVTGRVLGAADTIPTAWPINTTVYMALENIADDSGISTTELDSQVQVPVALVETDMFVRVVSNGFNSAFTTIALRVNGADSALAVSIGPGVSGAIEDSSKVALAVDDLVNWELATEDVGTGTITLTIISLEQGQPDDQPWQQPLQGIHRVSAARAY